VERAGGSRLAQRQMEHHRRLPPVAHPEWLDGMTEASVHFTDDFMVDALRHYRLQHRARRPMMILKAVLTLFLAGFGAFAFVYGPLVLGLFFVGLCFLLVFGHHIDFWLARRSLRRWAFRDETVTIEFTDGGFHARSPKQDTMLRWSSFTRVVHFRDGFLLFHGPASFHWIPASSLVSSSDVAGLEGLLQAKIAEHKIVEHVAAPNGGPATRLGSSGVAEGPPSVS
jgi:YcxB-like protein